VAAEAGGRYSAVVEVCAILAGLPKEEQRDALLAATLLHPVWH
jgi:hypothetical protein